MYEPRIIAFFCKWCVGATADIASVSRIQHPANVILIIVPCTGHISPHAIVEAFLNGADGY